MGFVFRKQTTRALPPNSERFVRKGVEYTRWTDSRGVKQTARVTVGRDGPPRIVTESAAYYARYRDEDGIVREASTGCRFKDTAEQELRRFEKRAEDIRTGLVSREQVAVEDHGATPLAPHAEDYLAQLRELGLSRTYQRDLRRYLERLSTECRFRTIADLDRATLKRWLARQKAGGMSHRLLNAHIQAASVLASWLVDNDRLARNPFAQMKRFDEKTDPRRPRRAFTVGELTKLLVAARERPLYDRLQRNRGANAATLKSATKVRLVRLGWERRLIYKVLYYTGLRVKELRSLIVAQVQLNENAPRLIVEAKDTKNRQEASLPLRKDLAGELREWIASKLATARAEALKNGRPVPARLHGDERLFDLSHDPSKILRRDLVHAGVDRFDGRGRRLDVHSLRVSLATHLLSAGVAPRVAQQIMRHSSVTLTCGVYTDPVLLDTAAAVEKLPALAETSESEPVARTGTDDRTVALEVALGAVHSSRSESIPDNTAGSEEPLQEIEVENDEVRNSASDHEKTPARAIGEQGNTGDPARILTLDLLLRRQSLYTG